MYAHTPNAAGEWHPLRAHLEAVAALARERAERFGGGAIAELLGFVHDAGKASPAFQAYLEKCASEPTRKHQSVDHKGAGTLLALERLEPAALLVDAHHGGLRDTADFRTTRLNDIQHGPMRGQIDTAQKWWLHEQLDIPNLDLARIGARFGATPRAFEFFLRMVFSTLVDADHLDTERHCEPEKADLRGESPSLVTLDAALTASQARLAEAVAARGEAATAVNRVRSEVYRSALDAALQAPGFFRLTVPTGGGKTRSALAFGLRHAVHHRLERVIFAVPYLTITDQTAAVFREVFADERAVLEHYSSAGRDDDEGGQSDQYLWRRLTAQDWDAPVIVTTTVQLFESLFGRRPGQCRKLHRLANSVIVLDEAQTLPNQFHDAIYDALTELTTRYGATVVFCTATQPAEESPPEAIRASVREIAPEPRRLFTQLHRVRYRWPEPGEQWSWEETGARLREHESVLAVVNTIKDALALFDALDDPDALHLSTNLCGAHRRDVLAEVRRRLETGQPCRVVSTQVVEAGVDIDFPVVFRALGPLDRIAQAAGRCNREGRLAEGDVVLFDPAEGGLPSGPYKTAADLTRAMAVAGPIDLHDPDVYPAFFARLAGLTDTDAHGIQPARERLAFETVAREFAMIEDGTTGVLVRYAGVSFQTPAERRRRESDFNNLMSKLEWLDLKKFGRAKSLASTAQPYSIGLRPRRLARAQGDGSVRELSSGMLLWEGRYDERTGLREVAADPLSFYIG